jgi:two-component system KDP operon response regulator KdpE
LPTLREELAARGLRVIALARASEALHAVERLRPAIVLVAARLPDASGTELMHQLQDAWDVPVILLGDEGDERQRIEGLDEGADDFVAKPFSAQELAARVRAVLRRTSRDLTPDGVIRLDGVEIDPERHIVRRRGRPVKLTRTEWMLLEHLLGNAGNVLLSRDLLSTVWGPQYASELRYLRVWISRLRHKVEPDRRHPRLIRTYSGMGYMLDLHGGTLAPPDGEDVEDGARSSGA